MTNSPQFRLPWDHPCYLPNLKNFLEPSHVKPDVEAWYTEIKMKFVKTPLGSQFVTIPRADLPASTTAHLPMDGVSMVTAACYVPRDMMITDTQLWAPLSEQMLDAIVYKSNEIGLLRITDLTIWSWQPNHPMHMGELEIIAACLVVPPVKIEHIR